MKLSVNIHVAKLTGYYGLGTVLLFNTFGFYNLPLGPKSFRAFQEMGHRRKGRGEFLGAFLASPFYACLLTTLPKFFELLTCAFWQKSIGTSSKGTLNLAY